MRELTTRELDMQLAEQLPARELMGGLFSRFSSISGNGNGNGNGNTTGYGSSTIVSFLNGNLDGNLNGNTLIININL
jgi:hypothetical protein